MDLKGGKQRRFQPLSESISDVLSLAILTYVADEAVPRTDIWARALNIFVPVKKESILINLSNTVCNALSYLSGDKYYIDFREIENPYIHNIRRCTLPEVDSVILFSGGADSLIGAVSSLEEHKKVILVGHHADTFASSSQRELIDKLNLYYPDQIDYRSCFVRRTKEKTNDRVFPLPQKCVKDHRIRSILFLTLALAHTELFKTDRINIFENGIISINAPLDYNRIGALSTRTTHPYFLSIFNDIASEVAGRNIYITNPFILKSKIEMAEMMPEDKRCLLRLSHSCAKYDMIRWYNRKEYPRLEKFNVRHCGYCLPCIYRRLSYYNIGIDDKNDYLVDVFSDLGNSHAKPVITENMSLDIKSFATFIRIYTQSDIAKKKALMMSNGRIPLSKMLSPTNTYNEYTLKDFIDMYDRYVERTIYLVRQMCSTSVRRILSV